jgi:hypothetical protein
VHQSELGKGTTIRIELKKVNGGFISNVAFFDVLK